MDRRKFIASVGTVGTVAIAGCGGDTNGGNGDTNGGNGDTNGGNGEEELYDQGIEEELVPNEVGSDWPENLVRNDEINENFLRGFTNEDENVIILMDVSIEETITEAEDSFVSSEATAPNNEEYPLGADEAFIFDDGEVGGLIWRNINAVGQTIAARQSGSQRQADRQRASRYGEITFDNYW